MFYSAPLSVDEQRATGWADIRSLSEALNPNDTSMTVEGHPAPFRFYLRAQRG